MVRASENQKEYIRKIENVLHVKFKGFSKTEASKFIDQYAPAYKRKMDSMQSPTFVVRGDEKLMVVSESRSPAKNEPSARQIAFAHDIEDVVGVPFTATTKAEASKYIDDHIKEYRQLSAERQMLHEVAMESEHGDWGNRDE